MKNNSDLNVLVPNLLRYKNRQYSLRLNGIAKMFIQVNIWNIITPALFLVMHFNHC